MNYEKIYNQIIEKAKSENRLRNTRVYYERHHIIPKCLGGTIDKTNLVLLTGREHFICHWLLSRIYVDNIKILNAFWCMCYLKGRSKKRYLPSSRAYNEAKEIQANYMKTRYWSDATKQKISDKTKGVPKSDLAKLNMSKAKKGKTPWNKGKPHSPETILKLKAARQSRAERERQNGIVYKTKYNTPEEYAEARKRYAKKSYERKKAKLNVLLN